MKVRLRADYGGGMETEKTIEVDDSSMEYELDSLAEEFYWSNTSGGYDWEEIE